MPECSAGCDRSPGGATPGKPVGLVHLCASTSEKVLGERVVIPGSRADVRNRSVVIALHLIRRLLGEVSASPTHSGADSAHSLR